MKIDETYKMFVKFCLKLFQIGENSEEITKKIKKIDRLAMSSQLPFRTFRHLTTSLERMKKKLLLKKY